MSRIRRAGLTLLELLILVAIGIFILLLFVPARRRIKDVSNRIICTKNLGDLMRGLDQYTKNQSFGNKAGKNPGNERDTPYPTGCIGAGVVPDERLSWLVELLPALGREELFKEFDKGKGYAGNLKPANMRLELFWCPSPGQRDLSGKPVTNYVAMAGVGLDAPSRPAGAPGNGFMGYDRTTTAAMIRDGTASTIALMETRANTGPWAQGGVSTVRGFDPGDLPISGPGRPYYSHEGDIHVAWADGSVRPVHSSIQPRLLASLFTIDGGEPWEKLD